MTSFLGRISVTIFIHFRDVKKRKHMTVDPKVRNKLEVAVWGRCLLQLAVTVLPKMPIVRLIVGSGTLDELKKMKKNIRRISAKATQIMSNVWILLAEIMFGFYLYKNTF